MSERDPIWTEGSILYEITDYSLLTTEETEMLLKFKKLFTKYKENDKLYRELHGNDEDSRIKRRVALDDNLSMSSELYEILGTPEIEHILHLYGMGKISCEKGDTQETSGLKTNSDSPLLETKQGLKRTIIGSVLIVVQLLSVIGNVSVGNQLYFSVKNFETFLFSLMYCFGYFLIGIIGLVILVAGLIARFKKNKPVNQCNTKKQLFIGVKKFFKKVFSKKYAATVIVSFVLFVSIIINVLLAVNVSDYKSAYEINRDKVEGYEDLVGSYQNDISDLRNELDFYNEYVVVVSDDGTNLYHKYGCRYFSDHYFWAYNTEKAIQLGYHPCSHCCD